MPHLHFEIRRGGQVVEPHAGPCGAQVSRWRQQLPYQDAFRVISTGQTRGALALGAVKGPPPHAEALAVGDTATVWVHLHNVRAGRVSRWSLVAPSGNVVHTFERRHDSFHSMSWWWAYFLPDAEGEWRIDYRHEGVLHGSHSFTVFPAEANAPRAALAGGAPRLIGGGETVHRGGGE
jgi:hypothetical protein